jgi:predicted GIY-YIG superfamily endonuclease
MIYILRFERPLGNPRNPRGMAQYYIGWCEEGKLDRRLAAHRAGRGAVITRAAVREGIRFDVIFTMPGSRKDERRLKNQKNTPRLVRRLLAAQAKV